MKTLDGYWVSKGLYFDLNAIASPCGPRWNY